MLRLARVASGPASLKGFDNDGIVTSSSGSEVQIGLGLGFVLARSHRVFATSSSTCPSRLHVNKAKCRQKGTTNAFRTSSSPSRSRRTECPSIMSPRRKSSLHLHQSEQSRKTASNLAYHAQAPLQANEAQADHARIHSDRAMLPHQRDVRQHHRQRSRLKCHSSTVVMTPHSSTSVLPLPSTVR